MFITCFLFTFSVYFVSDWNCRRCFWRGLLVRPRTEVDILTQVLQEADTETDEGLEELVSDVALALLRSEVIPQAPPPNPKP